MTKVLLAKGGGFFRWLQEWSSRSSLGRDTDDVGTLQELGQFA
jgi:hypothetical protein